MRRETGHIAYEFGSVKARFSGYLGEKIGNCITNGVMKTNYHVFIDAFRDKADSGGLFCGEFWGKWFTSAVLAYEYDPREEYREILADAVEGILECQEADGRLSCSGTDFTDWDIWGRKYVLLGLLSYYDLCQEKRVLTCAEQMTDNLIAVTREAGVKVTDIGLDLLGGISSCSLLQPIVRLYVRSGQERYLEYARWLVELWGEGSRFSEEGLRLIEGALGDRAQGARRKVIRDGIEGREVVQKGGKAPVEIAVPKAYEAMSCFEGVLELYLATGETRYLEAVETYMEKVLEREIMITGSGSAGELWCDGARRQVQVLETPMETCVTATILKLCRQLFCVTGKQQWADWMEVTLYNALLGAMREDGSWWAYFSPLQGQRVYSHVQIERMKSSCCVLNGPRALLEAPKWAVMAWEEGIAVNLYADGQYTGAVHGQETTLEITGDYPGNNAARIILRKTPGIQWKLRLRIPAYAGDAAVKVNGREMPCTAGEYCEIDRVWTDGDVIALECGWQPRIVTAPGNVSFQAVMAGPIVLALDRQRIRPKHKALRLMNSTMQWKTQEQGNFQYVLSQSLEQEGGEALAERIYTEGAYVSYAVRFLSRPIHFFSHEVEELTMCDYASCGKSFSEDSCIRVWLPQPMYLPAALCDGTGEVVAGTTFGE